MGYNCAHEKFIMSTRTSSLRKLIHLPVLVSQITGTFPLKFGLEADLDFSWLSWPSIIHLVKLVATCIGGLTFYVFRKEFGILFGGWSQTDMITSFLVGLVGNTSDIFTGVMMLMERDHILKFHSDVIEFAVDMVKTSSSSERKEQNEWLNGRRKWLERRVMILVFLAAAGYLGILFSAYLLGIIFEKPGWILMMLPLISYIALPLNVLRKVQVFILIGVLIHIWVGLRILRHLIHHQTIGGNPRDMDKVLRQWKRANDLVEKFNVILQWPLVCGTLTLLISILATFYNFCSWAVITGPMSAMATVPGMAGSFLTLFSICAVASQVNQEGRKCTNALRDLGECEWIQKEIPLRRQLRLYHVAAALRPTMVQPGHFFPLGRSLIPSVSCIKKLST